MASDKRILFKFFEAANGGDFDFVDRMDDDDVKSLSPYVMLMWFSGAQSNHELHTILTDTYCNDKVFQLSRHPRLLLMLFIAANCNIDNTRYTFRKSVSSDEAAVIKLVARHYKVGYDVAKQYHRLLSEEDIEEIKEIYEQ